MLGEAIPRRMREFRSPVPTYIKVWFGGLPIRLMLTVLSPIRAHLNKPKASREALRAENRPARHLGLSAPRKSSKVRRPAASHRSAARRARRRPHLLKPWEAGKTQGPGRHRALMVFAQPFIPIITSWHLR